MSKVVNVDDRPDKSNSKYPASNKKNADVKKGHSKKYIPKGFMRVDKNTSTLSL